MVHVFGNPCQECDAQRWRAFNAGGADWSSARSASTLFRCASCELRGEEKWVSPRYDTVVPWDVMGDDRDFVFVCSSCATAPTEWERGILTVRMLRVFLEGLDPDAHVLIAPPGDGEYLNINDVILPDGENYLALTLFASDTYDTRQF